MVFILEISFITGNDYFCKTIGNARINRYFCPLVIVSNSKSGNEQTKDKNHEKGLTVILSTIYIYK